MVSEILVNGEPINYEACEATPDDELRRQIMSCMVPKNEREHWACRRIEELEKGIDSVLSLINESYGVDGLHLNGDVAVWDELRTGGRFEEWLIDFDAAILDDACKTDDDVA